MYENRNMVYYEYYYMSGRGLAQSKIYVDHVFLR
jgi:hypothetical protein